MSDMGWSKHIADQDEAAERGCAESAKQHGYTAEQAAECDESSPLCGKDCPFIPSEK